MCVFAVCEVRQFLVNIAVLFIQHENDRTHGKMGNKLVLLPMTMILTTPRQWLDLEWFKAASYSLRVNVSDVWYWSPCEDNKGIRQLIERATLDYIRMIVKKEKPKKKYVIISEVRTALHVLVDCMLFFIVFSHQHQKGI